VFFYVNAKSTPQLTAIILNEQVVPRCQCLNRTRTICILSGWISQKSAEEQSKLDMPDCYRCSFLAHGLMAPTSFYRNRLFSTCQNNTWCLTCSTRTHNLRREGTIRASKWLDRYSTGAAEGGAFIQPSQPGLTAKNLIFFVLIFHYKSFSTTLGETL
jgi:hypothetical protein